MPRRKIAIEIIGPTEGIDVRQPGTYIDPRATPNVADCNVYKGVVQKDMGTSLLVSATATTPGALPINGIFEAVFAASQTLQVFNDTAMFIYTSTASGFKDDAQIYTGTYSDFWDVCMHNNTMIYTNGIDLVQYKSAYNATGDVMAGVATSSYKANAVVSFANHLNLYHTEESGAESYKRVRWTDVGALGFTGTDWTAGTAGFVDIDDAEGGIVAAENLGGGAVVVYCEHSIHLQEWIGGTSVYRFTKMIGGIDIPTRRCIAVNDDIHYVLTRENVYEYKGGREFIPIGDPIKNYLLENMNASAMGNAYIEYRQTENEIRVHFPSQGETYPDTCLVCKVELGYKWFRSYRPYSASGSTFSKESMTIAGLDSAFSTYTSRIGDWAGTAGAPITIYGDQAGNVVKADPSVQTIYYSGAATGQGFLFETKDLSPHRDIDPATKDRYDLQLFAEHAVRWITVKVEAKGDGTLNADYSVDAGDGWESMPEGAKTLTATWSTFTWDVDIAAEHIRYRFSNSGTSDSPQIRFIKTEFMPGSEAIE